MHLALPVTGARTRRRVTGLITLWCLALMILLPRTAHAQSASITGLVTDPSGLVVPGVSVTVTNMDTGVMRATVTNEQGYYTLGQLPQGTYRVGAELQGFKPASTPDVPLRNDQALRVDVVLELGGSAETITITSARPLLQTESSSTGMSLDTRAYAELPVAGGGTGRRANSFFLLVPGATGDPSAFNNSVAGAPTATREIQLDGASVALAEVQGGDGRHITVPPDAVEEVSIATTGYPAEFGNTGGGIERYFLKSGTNQLHGSAYNYFSSDGFNARGFFTPTVPEFKRNEAGATLGGPIQRNRAFFFMSVNHNYQNQQQFNIYSVPTEAFRRGDFSSWPQPIYDPATTRPHPTNPGQLIRDPFPGNIIPGDRIDPVATSILELVPLPNASGDYQNLQQDVEGGRVTKRTTFVAKIDHQLTNRHRLSGSLTLTRNNEDFPDTLPDPIGAHRLADQPWYLPRVTHDWVLSDSMVNQLRVGANLWSGVIGGDAVPGPNGMGWPEALGLRGMELATDLFPAVSWSFNNLAGQSYREYRQRTFTINDALTWVAGAHTVKFGFEVRRVSAFNLVRNRASLSFSRNQTALPGALGTTGLDFASFLLGHVNNGGFSVYGDQDFDSQTHTWQGGMFAQDDFKLTSRLTLNYGFRFDVSTPLVDANDYYSAVDTTRPNPAAGNLPGVYVFAGQDGNGSRLTPADKTAKNLSPRVGLAYRINDKAVLRSAYGLSYFQTGAYGGGNTIALNGAYQATSTAISGDQIEPAFVLSQGFPASNLVLPPLTTPELGVGGAVTFWHPTASRLGRMQSWNVAFQRELGSSMSAEIAYVGSRGDRLPINADFNQLDPGYLNLGQLLFRNINDPAVAALGYQSPYPGFNGSLGQALRPFPQFLSMSNASSDTRGTSTYHSFQAKLDRRYARGLYGTVAYTWSDQLTNAPNAIAWYGPALRNQYDLEMSKFRPANYLPHALAAGFLYELPFGEGGRWLRDGLLAKVVGGWQLSGVFRYTSGPPLGVGAPQTNPTYTQPQTADVVAGVPMTLDTTDFDPRTDRYLNIDAFALPSGAFGNSPTTIDGLRGFAYLNEDLAVTKKTRLGDDIGFELRFEVFNVFNRVVFGSPASNLANPTTFGTITSQANAPRSGQIAARLTF